MRKNDTMNDKRLLAFSLFATGLEGSPFTAWWHVLWYSVTCFSRMLASISVKGVSSQVSVSSFQAFTPVHRRFWTNTFPAADVERERRMFGTNTCSSNRMSGKSSPPARTTVRTTRTRRISRVGRANSQRCCTPI